MFCGHLGAWLVDRPILPTPWAVYMYFPHLLNMDLWWNIYFSLYRLALSLVFATLIGVPLGIMSVRLPKFGALFEPLVYFTYPIPKIALLPVIMLLAGLGNASKDHYDHFDHRLSDHHRGPGCSQADLSYDVSSTRCAGGKSVADLCQCYGTSEFGGLFLR